MISGSTPDSRIVLGGAIFQKMVKSAISRLLENSSDLGVKSIDTAPLYGGSEKAIGEILKGDETFRISTKVGRPFTVPFTRDTLNASIEKSLKTLKRDSVECIYIHSLPPNLLSDSLYEAMMDLKKFGVTKKIGISSDSHDLHFYRSLSIFDSCMSTLNIVDQSNLSDINYLIEKKNVEITIKRALANGVWRRRNIPRLKSFVKNLGQVQPEPDIQSYAFRHKLLRKISTQDLNGWLYMQYALSWNSSAKVLIGTSKVSHLRIFREIELEKRLSKQQIDEIQNMWKFANKFEWEALV